MNTNSEIKVSKSELINTFSDIDIRINQLHQRSSTDFMKLNDYLKDYHKKTRIISENATRIFETISGGKDMDLIKELSSIHHRLEEYRRNLRLHDSQRLGTLKEVLLKCDQLSVILKNLRQDFTTLKFLSTNFSIISNYNESGKDLNENINIWNSEINSLHQSLVSVSNSIENFREKISGHTRTVAARVENSVDVYQNLSRETIKNIDLVTLKNLESKLQFPLLKEKSVESSKSINDIITHLQYHDIIRQKIEHIQKSHQKIIQDLNSTVTDNESGNSCSADDYSKIGDIIDLQAAQLLLVSKEYQNALNVITRNFQDIARDLTTISGISDKFSLKDSSSGVTLLKQIKDQLDKGIIMLDLNNYAIINAEYQLAQEKLEELSSQMKQLIKPLLIRFTGMINNSKNSAAKGNSGSGVFSQIISLLNDIEIKNHDILQNINEIRNLTGSIFISDNTDMWENQLELDRLQLMVKISKILDSLDKDNEELDSVLNQNRELNNTILEKIENTINKGDYYEYFENIVEEVIGNLNDINGRIRPSANIDKKAANLNDIKGSYTMESERVIHEKVVSGNENPIAGSLPNDENDIEFF
jgi:predicted  nucleic acid-binding Zn-ribbon protein